MKTWDNQKHVSISRGQQNLFTETLSAEKILQSFFLRVSSPKVTKRLHKLRYIIKNQNSLIIFLVDHGDQAGGKIKSVSIGVP